VVLFPRCTLLWSKLLLQQRRLLSLLLMPTTASCIAHSPSLPAHDRRAAILRQEGRRRLDGQGARGQGDGARLGQQIVHGEADAKTATTS
jgi:hypothetical protein